jgi:putative ABC transport system substrate-binding protein
MQRRKFIALLGAAAALPVAARAQQQAGKVRRIGILEPTSQALNRDNLDAFRQGLHEFEYTEGQNLVIEYRSADGHNERFANLAAELARLNVDLILARGTPAVLAAKNATRMIPIVLLGVGDPVAQGVVASLARPGANITGLSASATELYAKRLELLTELVPRVAQIAFLTNMDNPNEELNWEQIEKAARVLGIRPQLLDARKPEDFERAFDNASEQRVDALVVALDGLLLENPRLIVDLAAKHRLPAVYGSRVFIGPGGLAAYGPSYADLYRRAANYADKILKGAKPAARRAADEIPATDQPKDRQGAWPRGAADAACPRRRGDRLGRRLQRRMSPVVWHFSDMPKRHDDVRLSGAKPTSSLRTDTSSFDRNG